MNAIIVLVITITLYGILKSGVGSEISNGGVYIRMLLEVGSPGNVRIIAPGMSTPRCASGTNEVYFKNANSTSIESDVVEFGGNVISKER
jgi:hypothetical protein